MTLDALMEVKKNPSGSVIAYPSEASKFTPVFSGVRVTPSLVLFVCFVDCCLSFCLFFFWPLCYLSFFDLRILIIPLVSSRFSSSSTYYLLNKM